MGILFILLVVCLVAMVLLRRSNEKSEREFANRPYVITNPAKDLFSNEKYAIVRLFALVQGASPLTAFDEDISEMVQSIIFSLGLSKSEVEWILKNTMSNPERETHRMIESLKEIRDKNYLRELYHKCHKIALIGGDSETIEVVNAIFKNELEV